MVGVPRCAVSTRSERSTKLATSSSIAIAFEDFNDEGSHITVFRVPGTTSARLSTTRQHTEEVDLGGSDQDDTIISCIVYFRSWLCARLSVSTKRTRSGRGQPPYLLAPDA